MKPSLVSIYDVLFRSFGPQRWWPGETPFEVMVGAILTQNTNWGNVEKAIINLKHEGLLSVEAMHRVAMSKLSEAIRPAGYFNVKARRLKNLVGMIVEIYRGDIERMRPVPLVVLREQLLAVNGVGPETADSILLYALDRPVFVVDAYTRRFLIRHNLATEAMDYHDIQKMFMDILPHDSAVFNEYHALIVRLGKDMCRPSAKCEACPLNRLHYRLDSKCHRCHRSFLYKETRRTSFLKKGEANGPRAVCEACWKTLRHVRG